MPNNKKPKPITWRELFLIVTAVILFLLAINSYSNVIRLEQNQGILVISLLIIGIVLMLMALLPFSEFGYKDGGIIFRLQDTVKDISQRQLFNQVVQKSTSVNEWFWIDEVS
jgi:hypothetical protein